MAFISSSRPEYRPFLEALNTWDNSLFKNVNDEASYKINWQQLKDRGIGSTLLFSYDGKSKSWSVVKLGFCNHHRFFIWLAKKLRTWGLAFRGTILDETQKKNLAEFKLRFTERVTNERHFAAVEANAKAHPAAPTARKNGNQAELRRKAEARRKLALGDFPENRTAQRPAEPTQRPAEPKMDETQDKRALLAQAKARLKVAKEAVARLTPAAESGNLVTKNIKLPENTRKAYEAQIAKNFNGALQDQIQAEQEIAKLKAELGLPNDTE